MWQVFVRFGGVVESLSRARGFFRLTPYDTSTEAGRALERTRRATWTTTTNLLAQTLSALVDLVSIPLTIGYLGKEPYGMWMAIGALLTWAVLADLGMARGLQNHLSDAYGRDDPQAAGRAMSTAFFFLASLALLIGVFFVPSLVWVPWERLLRISDPRLQEQIRPVLVAVVVVFLAQFPLGVVRKAYAAYQRGHVANLFSIGGSLLSMGALLLVIEAKMGLPWLVLARGGVVVLVELLNLAYLIHDVPFLRPRLSLVSRSALGGLLRISVPMLLFELGSLLINEVQIVIIARERGVAMVTDYSVYLRVMSVPIFLVNMLDGPYVPMYREALARGDRDWFRRTFFTLQGAKLGVSLLAAGLCVVAGDWLAGKLSGGVVAFGPLIWALAGFLMVVGCWNGGYNNLFFTIERLWTLVVIILLNGVVTLALTLWLTGPHGMIGVLVASTLFSLLVSGWLLPWLSRDVFRQQAKES